MIAMTETTTIETMPPPTGECDEASGPRRSTAGLGAGTGDGVGTVAAVGATVGAGAGAGCGSTAGAGAGRRHGVGIDGGRAGIADGVGPRLAVPVAVLMPTGRVGLPRGRSAWFHAQNVPGLSYMRPAPWAPHHRR